MMKRPLVAHELEELIQAGPLALSLHWTEGNLVEIRTHWAEKTTESPSLSAHATKLKTALTRYVAGKAPRWPDLPYDFSRLTDFQQTVLTALYDVPFGTLCTYGELAKLVGRPRGAQAIGRAMASNPFPVVYPCHRVIGANGELTGFSAEGGLDMKEFLLRLEGSFARLSKKGRPSETGRPSLFDHMSQE